MTTEWKYQLIKSGKFNELELEEKMEYWISQKFKAEYMIELYLKKLSEIQWVTPIFASVDQCLDQI